MPKKVKLTSVKEVVEVYAKVNGYTGLKCLMGTCVCPVSDLFPCANEWKEECVLYKEKGK